MTRSASAGRSAARRARARRRSARPPTPTGRWRGHASGPGARRADRSGARTASRRARTSARGGRPTSPTPRRPSPRGGGRPAGSGGPGRPPRRVGEQVGFGRSGIAASRDRGARPRRGRVGAPAAEDQPVDRGEVPAPRRSDARLDERPRGVAVPPHPARRPSSSIRPTCLSAASQPSSDPLAADREEDDARAGRHRKSGRCGRISPSRARGAGRRRCRRRGRPRGSR